jgi:ABC-type sugar transport system ATPase subunit
MSAAPLLELRAVAKSFGGARALRGVDFTLQAGEVHALLGENGAGKSTLIKIVTGAHQPDAGTLAVGVDRLVLLGREGARVLPLPPR